jgi:hypothetical protein
MQICTQKFKVGYYGQNSFNLQKVPDGNFALVIYNGISSLVTFDIYNYEKEFEIVKNVLLAKSVTLEPKDEIYIAYTYTEQGVL